MADTFLVKCWKSFYLTKLKLTQTTVFFKTSSQMFCADDSTVKCAPSNGLQEQSLNELTATCLNLSGLTSLNTHRHKQATTPV